MVWLSGSYATAAGSNGYLLDVITGRKAANFDAFNYFARAVHTLGVINTRVIVSSDSGVRYDGPVALLHGVTEFTLVSTFIFRVGATSAQWLNFRVDNQHTLDVISQTSSTLTFGCDWAGAWNGATTQTLSGLKDGDVVTICAVVNQAGARFFANGRFIGTKSGTGFTVSTASDSTAIVNMIRTDYVQGMASKKALPDAVAMAITADPTLIFREQAMWIAGASSVTAYNAAVTESASASDSCSAVLNAVAAMVEAATSSDVQTAALSASANVSESSAATDAATASAQMSAQVSESVTVSDAMAATKQATASVSEAVAASDAASAVATMTTSNSDTLTATDVTAPSGTLNAAVVEGVAASDTSSAALAATASVVESVSAADVRAAAAAFIAAQLETVTASDLTDTSGASLSASLSDSISPSDSQSAFMAAIAACLEQVTASDTISCFMSAAASVIEAGSAIDVCAATGGSGSFARAPAGNGYSPRRDERCVRPAAIQRNNR
jgi:hypothetical protein